MRSDDAIFRPSTWTGLRSRLPGIRAALRRATIAGKAVPVLLGAAFKNKVFSPFLTRWLTTCRLRPTCPPVAGHALDGVPCFAFRLG